MVKLVATYSKSRSIHGGRGTPVVRCSDSYKAGLLLRIFLLFVPVEAAFAGIDTNSTTFGEGLDGHKQFAKHYAMDFSHQGGVTIGSKALRSIFQRARIEHELHMNTSQYRHIQAVGFERFGSIASVRLCLCASASARGLRLVDVLVRVHRNVVLGQFLSRLTRGPRPTRSL
jgi:hypothetical protein